MKKTILLTAITIISAMAINKSSAQYNDGYGNDNRGYNYNQGRDFHRGDDRDFHHGDDRDFRRDEHREFHERIDMDFNRRRINELQYAMQADRNCGNWEAFHYHERELQNVYAEINRARDIAFNRFNDDRRGAYHY